jgi:hypothetical protein
MKRGRGVSSGGEKCFFRVVGVWGFVAGCYRGLILRSLFLAIASSSHFVMAGL